jgi:hypothetical protein
MISDTLRVVLLHTKAEHTTFEWKELAGVLEPLYYHDLKMLDVLAILTTVYEEARAEPKFEMPGQHNGMFDLIVAPVKGHFSIDLWGPKSPDVTYTVDQFYTAIIKQMLSDLRLTRVDWLRTAGVI